MNWIKVEIQDTKLGNRVTNVPFGRILVSDGTMVEYVDEHGWDKEEYYFYNGTGKMKGITHFMLLPNAPK